MKLERFRRPSDEPSFYATVGELLAVLPLLSLKTPIRQDNALLVRAQKALGVLVSARVVEFAAWELYYNEPLGIARVRAMRALHGTWQR